MVQWLLSPPRDQSVPDPLPTRQHGHELLVRLRALLPDLNFITVHYLYFLIICLLTSVVFWGSSDPARSISYVDSLYLVTSAMTEAGLNTVNLSQMTTWQQVLLFLLIVFGSSIWVSIFTVHFRKSVFEKRLKDIVLAERSRANPWPDALSNLPIIRTVKSFRSGNDNHAVLSAITAGRSSAQPPDSEKPVAVGPDPAGTQDSDKSQEDTGATTSLRTLRGVALPERRNEPAAGGDSTRIASGNKRGPRDGSGSGTAPKKLRLWSDKTPQLTREERQLRGGCEYRALRLLGIIVPLYWFLWQLLGCTSLGAWMRSRNPGPARANAISPFWLGVFNGASAFNNSGMSLLDANMMPFQDDVFILIVMGLMILAGNSCYPIFLRLTLWLLLKLLNWATAEEALAEEKETLTFMLKYPRRVYTNLFNRRATWWLAFTVILLNGIDWAAFELLNIGNPVIQVIPRGSRVLDGLFQALAVRCGGFYVVDIARLYPGLQVLYAIMMYISAYPVTITMRHSNMYEEQSLGIYAPAEKPDGDNDAESAVSLGPTRHFGRRRVRSHIDYLKTQMRGKLANDLWWLVLAVLIITTVETGNFLAQPVAYSIFNVIFEVVSAYGCVGISVGLPNHAYSFSGGWHAASKLVLCAVMIRGRHRGLPIALDRAVRLPSEQMLNESGPGLPVRRNSMAPGT